MPRRAKGPHLLYRAREARWYIRDGDVERSTGCGEGERGGAEAALQSYLAEKHTPSFGRGDPSRVLVTDVLILYMQERAPETQSLENVRVCMAHLIDFWASKTVAEITPQACRVYARRRMDQPNRNYKDPKKAPRVSAASPRRELEVLSAALHYAHREHKLTYVSPVALPKKPVARDRWLTRGEAARLLWAARKTGNGHVARFVLLGLYTGTRHRAILALRWMPSVDAGWVDLDRRILYRKGSREQESKKRRTPVPLSDRLLAHLRRWKAQSATHVVEWRGEPLLRLRGSWDHVRETAKLDKRVTPHALRHTFATWAVQDGQPLGHVAAALGTTEEIVSAVYGHHHPDRLRGVVNSVSQRRG